MLEDIRENLYTHMKHWDPMLPNLQGCLGSTLFIQAKMSFLTHIHWCTLVKLVYILCGAQSKRNQIFNGCIRQCIYTQHFMNKIYTYRIVYTKGREYTEFVYREHIFYKIRVIYSDRGKSNEFSDFFFEFFFLLLLYI